MTFQYELKPIFAGIQKFSTIDDNDNLSIILFTGGCNFRCKYCYNLDFVIPSKIKFLSINKICEILEKRKGLVESIVICGGEPTLHKNIINWLKYIKDLGYRIKFDTNATNYKIIKEIIDKNLVDFFSIDYKAPNKKYEQITQTKLNENTFLKTISLIISSKIEYEFRTTVHSDLLNETDINQIIDELKKLKAKAFYLQNYLVNSETIKPLSQKSSKNLILKFSDIIKKDFERGGVRNVEF